jgi:type IV pilus assembly protein PilQ
MFKKSLLMILALGLVGMGAGRTGNAATGVGLMRHGFAHGGCSLNGQCLSVASVAATAVAPRQAVFTGPAPSGGKALVQLAQNQTSPAPGLSQLANVKSEKTANGVAVTLESTGSLQYTAFKLQRPLRLVMDFPKTRQGILDKPLVVTGGVVESVRPVFFEEAEVLRLEFSLKGAANYEIVRPGPNALVVQFTEAAPAKEPAAQPAQETVKAQPPAEKMPTAMVAAPVSSATDREIAPREAKFSESFCTKILSGEKEKVSLDFQGAQVANIFRILADVGGFNVVLHPDVKGETNVRLVDIPWNQALELILKNNGMGKQCFGNIVRIAPMKSLEAEEKQRTDTKKSKKLADTEEELSSNLETEVLPINYANLEDMAKNLEKMVTKRGRVSIDKRTNTMVLTDVRNNLDIMAGIVRNLDRATKQISIQARIVEATRTAAKTLGVQWGGSVNRTTNKEFPTTVDLGTNSNLGKKFIVDLPNAAKLLPFNAAGVGLSLGSLTKDVVLDIQLSALEEQGQGRTLSSPRVTTLDNKEAKIQAGRKIPYTTVSQDGTKIQFVDATLELNVTPHVTREQNILLKIQAKKNAADFSRPVNGVPTITTKEAFTEVQVEDAETTVLGGLYENTVQSAQGKVPFFADIPLLGYMFRNFSDTLNVEELLIFITPTIIQER